MKIDSPAHPLEIQRRVRASQPSWTQVRRFAVSPDEGSDGSNKGAELHRQVHADLSSKNTSSREGNGSALFAI